MSRRGIALLIASAILLGAGVVGRAQGLEQERADAVAELRALASQARDAEQRTDHLAGAIERAEVEAAHRDQVLAVRPAFVDGLAALRSALDRAAGAIDTASHRAAALAAQQTVLAERSDPDTVVAATATVEAITARVGSELASRSAGPGGPAWTTSGPDGYARVRAALDRVGGAGIGLYESASCRGATAPACANSNGYIKYRADIVGWDTARLNWAMAHELAHIHQFRIWGALTSSPAYSSLFGGDAEFLANCMAVVRGFPGPVGCDEQQQIWASAIWVGVVR